jgi:hypothetical protein
MTEIEWGVRFPSGAVQSYGANEDEARRFALATSSLRPDLPTLVVRQVVRPWHLDGEVVCDDGQANDCRHDSATGIDLTSPRDPEKVWRCDHCGLLWNDDGRLTFSPTTTPRETDEMPEEGDQ